MFIRNSMQSHRVIVIVPFRWQTRRTAQTYPLPCHSARRTTTSGSASISMSFVFRISMGFRFLALSIFMWLSSVAIYNEMSRRRTRDGKANESFHEATSVRTHECRKNIHTSNDLEIQNEMRKMYLKLSLLTQRKYWKLLHACACVLIAQSSFGLVVFRKKKNRASSHWCFCDFVAARNWSNCIEWLTVFNLVASNSIQAIDCYCSRSFALQSMRKAGDEVVHHHWDWVASSHYVLDLSSI